MKKFGAFVLIILAFGWAFWMSAQTPKREEPPGGNANDWLSPEGSIPRPPDGGGPAAFLEYAYQLQTATAEPMLRATQQAEMSSAVLEQRIFTDGLTATSAYALTQQSVNLTATPVSQTATARYEGTQQANFDQQLAQTKTAGIAATSLAQTQIAPLIQAQAEAERKQANVREMMFYLFAVVSAIVFLLIIIQYKEYLDDRRTNRSDTSAVKRVVQREGASPLFITRDEKVIDPDKAFYPDATEPAPSIEHQERVTQRTQAIKMAHEVARGLAASPGTHTQNYLANLAAQWTGANSQSLRQLPPEIKVLDTPPPYAGDVENQAIEDGEVVA